MENRYITSQKHFLIESARGKMPIAVEDGLYNQRTIFFTREVNVDSCAMLMQELMYLDRESSDEPITIYINSAGGDVNSGLFLFDYIMSMKSQVNTVCIGRAYSMAAILFLAGDNRAMYQNSKLMLHGPSVMHSGDSGFNKNELNNHARFLNEYEKVLKKIVVDCTGLREKIVQNFFQKDTYFKANKAFNYHLATEIIENKKR